MFSARKKNRNQHRHAIICIINQDSLGLTGPLVGSAASVLKVENKKSHWGKSLAARRALILGRGSALAPASGIQEHSSFPCVAKGAARSGKCFAATTNRFCYSVCCGGWCRVEPSCILNNCLEYGEGDADGIVITEHVILTKHFCARKKKGSCYHDATRTLYDIYCTQYFSGST